MAFILLHFSQNMIASGWVVGWDLYQDLIYTMNIKYVDPLERTF